MEQTLYKISSAMKKMDVSRSTIYRLAARGELVLVKIGQTTRITGESIERLVGVLPTSSPTIPDAEKTSNRHFKKGNTHADLQTVRSEADLMKRITDLEKEVTAIRKFISRLKEAANERP